MRLNCWIVAMRLWLMSHAKGYAWIRRSKSFRGAIPHFGYAEDLDGHVIVIEYVPPKGRRWTIENRVIVFRGLYRVTILRQEESALFPTLKTATDWATQTVLQSAQPSAEPSSPGSCSHCGR